ncbi:MAG: DNA polymerase III subunit gamma and tau [Propionibacteriaceae bacterium]|nr:DNA polymerase III subunit gamma and tau [Propionibacteriaceae bacterium]
MSDSLFEDVAADAPGAPLALYRRYRPETFAEVIGQEHVTEPLMRALSNNRVSHAYLFSGPRGCGKTTSARILARCLNCEKGPAPVPCGECQSCVELARGGTGSIDVIEIDAASHGGVDDARDLRDRAFFAPASSRFKIYIIDEAHMVTQQGFNALLKVVEEPPPHVKFIFATTEPEKVIGTIRSRTHHYPFRLVPPRTLSDYLAKVCEHEHVAIDPLALPLVVQAGAGSVRDSLSVLDQLLGSAGEGGVSYADAAALLGFTPDALLDEIVEAFNAGDAAGVFGAVDKVIETGLDPRRFAEDLLKRLRDLILLAEVPDATANGLLDVSDDQAERLQKQVKGSSARALTKAAEIIAEGLTGMRGTTAPRLHLELMCARVLVSAQPEPAAPAFAPAGLSQAWDGAGSGTQPQNLTPSSPSQGRSRDYARDDEVGGAATVGVGGAANGGVGNRVDVGVSSHVNVGVGVGADSGVGNGALSGAAPDQVRGRQDQVRENVTETVTGMSDQARGRQDQAWGRDGNQGSGQASGTSAPVTAASAAPAQTAATQPVPVQPAPAAAAPAAPAPAQPAAGQGNLPTLDVIKRRWPQAIAEVQKISKVTAIMLGPSFAKLLGMQGNLLTIGFQEGAQKSFSSGDHKAQLERVLSAGFRTPIKVEAVLDTSAGMSAPNDSAADSQAIQAQPSGTSYSSSRASEARPRDLAQDGAPRSRDYARDDEVGGSRHDDVGGTRHDEVGGTPVSGGSNTRDDEPEYEPHETVSQPVSGSDPVVPGLDPGRPQQPAERPPEQAEQSDTAPGQARGRGSAQGRDQGSVDGGGRGAGRGPVETGAQGEPAGNLDAGYAEQPESSFTAPVVPSPVVPYDPDAEVSMDDVTLDSTDDVDPGELIERELGGQLIEEGE